MNYFTPGTVAFWNVKNEEPTKNEDETFFNFRRPIILNNLNAFMGILRI